MQSVLVYTLTFLLMFSASVLYKNGRSAVIVPDMKFRRWDILACLVFTIVFGLRYNVGIDYANYKEMYDTHEFERLEYIFRGVSELFAANEVHVTIYFALWAFLQIYILMKAFQNEKFIYPALIFTLFAGQYFLLWMNVIRQDIAACIFIYSIAFIVDKKFLKYLLCIVLACGFHKTAILLLAVYPILRYHKNYFNNIPVQLGLLLVSVVIGLKSAGLMDAIDRVLEPILLALGYEEYAFGGVESSMSEVKIGVSFLATLMIDFMIIAYSKRMKAFYANDRFLCFYDLYYAGIVLNMLLANSFILQRPVRYFRFFKMIIAAYLLYYLYKNGKSKINVIAFIVLIALFLLLYISLFRYAPDACYIYYFFWQQ